MLSVTSTLNISSDDITPATRLTSIVGPCGRAPRIRAPPVGLLAVPRAGNEAHDLPVVRNPERVDAQDVHAQGPRETHKRGEPAQQGVKCRPALLGEGVRLGVEEYVYPRALPRRDRHGPQVVGGHEDVCHVEPQVLAVEEVTDVAGVVCDNQWAN